jgi:hypothetical protein
MTSPTYHADDDQLADEHDRAVPENTLTEPDTDLAVAGPGLAVAEAEQTRPDTDPMTPDSDLTAPDAGQAVHEDPASQPAAPVALADDAPAASIAPDYPGFTAGGDDGAQEPGMTGSSPMNPSLVSVALTVPASVNGSRPAGHAASAGGPWNEIQSMFVDDPRASIERAAGLVDDRVEALIQSVRERQRSAQAAWQADAAGTEELRIALQHYRTFWNSLEDLPAHG